MNRNIFTAFAAAAALAALLVGCQSKTNTDANANTNTAAAATNASADANTHAATTGANRSITREEFERDRERHRREAKESGSRIGRGAEDLWLWTKTRADLLATSGLTSTGISVDVNDGVITLRGTVPDAAQKTRAEQVARAVEGNKGVRDQLTVSAGGADRNANRNANANGHARGNANTK